MRLGLVSGLLLIIFLSLSGCAKEQALIITELDEWGISDATGNLVIRYKIYNFGYAPAENLEYFCKVVDENNDNIGTTTDIVDEVPETAVSEREFVVENPEMTKDEIKAYRMQCYATKCINCELLEERIPEIIDSRI
ncbi:hypothetical protein KY320_02795 [Candidatus Woesearchaeota archaeon]|nr:hypothetical protein [Candidatus Woesearchaeota archaeon]